MKDLAYDPLGGDGMTRTDMDCTNCQRVFVGKIDHGIEGNHVIICPHCGHEHCRVIQNGKITSERWDSRFGEAGRYTGLWTHDSLKIETSTAAQLIRDRWLNRSQ